MANDLDDDLDLLARERLEEVRAAWRLRHKGQSVGTITPNDVDEIILLLAQHGVPPTVRSVRDVYGGGSPNVITPLVRGAWLQRDLPRRLASLEKGKELPPRLLQFWELLLADAREESKKDFANQQREIADIRSGLDAQMEALVQREQVLDERLAGMQAQLQMAEASVGELRGSLAERTRERDALKVEVTQLRDQHHAEVRQLRERLDVAEASSADARERLAVREGELTTARAEAAAQTRRADDAKALADQARAEAASSAERANRLVVERAQLDLDLADTRTRLAHETARADGLAAQHSALADELQGVRSEHSTLHATLERRGTDLLQLQNSLAQARATITVHEHIEADLRRTREELAKVMRDRDQMLRNPPALLQRLEAIEALLQRLAPPSVPF